MEISEQVERFKDFVGAYYKIKLHEAVQSGKRSIVCDFALLSEFDVELAEELLDDPENLIRAAELSLESFDLPKEVLNFRVRFTNLPKSQTIRISDVREKDLNKFVCIEGIIRQSSDVRPQVVHAKFECPNCGNLHSIIQLEERFKEPNRCSCGRRNRFRLISKILVDAQHLLIEEDPEVLIGGEQPKRLTIFLKEDLVEPRMEKRTTPGAKIAIYGIIKETPVFLRSGQQSTRYLLAMDTNYIEPREESYDDIEISREEEEDILNLASDPDVYKRLVKSIAPSIYGHEDIKEALVLQLMGGVKKERKDGTVTRGDMHVLLVGDPGAAKSTLLMYMAKAAPKARYVAGKGATAAGLTASVVRDEVLKGWALEAGAIVLANGGFLMLDELDKMDETDRAAMHEALAQQRVTISKANIHATLKAETTVLAAANPKFGRFDPFKTIAMQIDLPPTLINRFDLIFPVMDIPNRENDSRIAGHVLNLQRDDIGSEPEIPIKLMKKYVAYARQKVKPILSDAALNEIKDFYVNLRNKDVRGEGERKPIPISARQLEALVRLAEGSARVRLSKNVTRDDAKRAIKLLKHCLMQVGFDYETQNYDIDMIDTGISTNERTKMGIMDDVRNIINYLCKEEKSTDIDEIYKIAKEKNIEKDKVDEAIERLKQKGDIFERKPGEIHKL